MQSNATPEPRPPEPDEGIALFLDLDGTIVDLAETPDAVVLRPGTMTDLQQLSSALGGALALVSGRTLADIDRIFAPVVFPAAGNHGAEVRLADGTRRNIDFDASRLAPARAAFSALAARYPGTLVEDKGVGLAVHFRRNPEAASAVREVAGRLSGSLGNDVRVLEGKMMVELRTCDATKGTAVESLLHTKPFHERRPFYFGDDVTDEDAFRAVNRLGGASVVVGAPTVTEARFRLESVTAMHEWLNQLKERLGRNGE